MCELLNCERLDGAKSRLTFHKESGTWHWPSISSAVDDEISSKSGRDLPKLPSRVNALLADKDRRTAHMGCPADTETSSGSTYKAVLKFIPPLPCCRDANAELGCTYYDEQVSKSHLISLIMQLRESLASEQGRLYRN
jgi:hypothetical protein